jgi:ABC-type multidrug transport system fused ATPase/permease subunit
MKYESSKNNILDDISFIINPGEKIGIIGRTGSGKSSLFKSILRIVEIENGEILINDENINKFELSSYRSKLSIILQDPILLNGTIKENLDPLKLYSDEKIWDVLKDVQLFDFLNTKTEKLNFVLENGGDNISVGQRQLMCLARAILKDSMILLMDEPTSSVDLETDKVIQDIIKKSFSKCTILTIAHRLNTISDYDKILEIDNGKIIKFEKIIK